jgi:hypothetical protein
MECSTDSRDVCNILVGKTEGKSLLGRTERKRKHNNKMDLREIWGEVVD